MKPLVHHWQVAVLVPARNEEILLPRCLDSIQTARAHAQARAEAEVRVVVVSDGSEDATTAIARRLLGPGDMVRDIFAGCVGEARQVAAEMYLSRLTSGIELLSRCWLANTDADCVVPHTWLYDQLSLAENGVEAIAGVVSVDDFSEHGPEVRARFKASYLIEADDRHPHVHGANLGVRADAYLRAGGWRHLQTAEDHDLWRRLRTSGARQFSTSRLEVQTSGRRIGRAPDGFAAALAAHNETAA